MKESVWGYAIIFLGVAAIFIMWFMSNTTRTDQHNYNLLKETVEAAMYDAVDLSAYRKDGIIKIQKAKFIENFVRRFAENADLSNTYRIEIYDVNEAPPKVSIRVSTKKIRQNFLLESDINKENDLEFNIVNNIDAILESKYMES